MCPGRWRALTALTLCLLPFGVAYAGVVTDPLAPGLADRVRNLLPFLAPTPILVPQAVEQAPQDGPKVDPTHLDMPETLEHDLREAIADPIGKTRLTVVGGTARIGSYSLGSTETYHGHLVVLKGNAEIHGRLEGNLVTLDGDIILHPGSAVIGDVLAINGRIRGDPGAITGSSSTLQPREVVAPIAIPALIGRRALGLLAVLATFTLLGFALVTFGRPNLEIVSDTVMHSFGRSFTAGLLAQVLLLPTFGMLVVGLVLTIAGALLVPFAAAVYLILAIVSVVGGVIAVAHAMGETITRRRMARGRAVSPNAYRYVATGLTGIAAVWLAWVIAGWVPVAGPIAFLLAALATWFAGTVGFGAALLSRGGIQEDFAGRFLPPAMMTDEYLWATPMVGVPAVKRPPTSDR